MLYIFINILTIIIRCNNVLYVRGDIPVEE